jgi:hypothetical protein
VVYFPKNAMLNEYRSPSPEQLKQLQQAEDLYCQVEAFIRANLKPGTVRQQALFRLRESETWTKEGIKDDIDLDQTLDEPAPR